MPEPRRNSPIRRAVHSTVRLLGPIGAVLIATAFVGIVVGQGAWRTSLAKAAVGALLLLAYLLLQGRQQVGSFRLRMWRLRAMDALWLISLGSFLLALNLLAHRTPLQWDVSTTQVHSLAGETQDLLADLPTAVEIIAFVDAADKRRNDIDKRLQLFARASPKIHVRSLDPNLHPRLTARYSLRSDSPPLVLRHWRPSPDPRPPGEASGSFERAGFDEASIALGIYRLTRQDRRTVYIVEAPGEERLQQSKPEGLRRAVEILQRQGYIVAPLQLQDLGDSATPRGALAGRMPEDAAVVLLPRIDNLTAIHVRTLENTLASGGRMLVLADPALDRTPAHVDDNTKPETAAVPRIGHWLRSWKVHAREDIVVDSIGQVYGLGWSGPFIQPRRGHPITDGLDGMLIFKTARTLQPLHGGLPHVLCDVVAETTRSAFAETNLVQGTPHQDEEDLVGPLPVAIACADRSRDEHADDAGRPAETGESSGGGRLLVIGDGDFISNRLIGQQRNADFFLRAVAWLAARKTPFAVEAHRRRASAMALSPSQLGLVRLWTLDLIPAFFIACGAVVVGVRRRRRDRNARPTSHP